MKDLIEHKSLTYVVDECKKRGIACRALFRNVLEMEYNGHREIIADILSSKTSAVAYYICKTKDTAEYFMDKAGLNTPLGTSYSHREKSAALEHLRKEKFTCVLKPNDGFGGDLVFVGIKNEEDFQNAWAAISGKYERILIEKIAPGEEYRFLATKNKLLSVAKRVPASVTGNGVDTIEELIEAKNSQLMERSRKPIVIDNFVSDNIKKQGMSINSIPKPEETVYLRRNSNISTGGDSIDYTLKIDTRFADIAIQAVNSIPGLEWAGVDIMTENIEKMTDYSIIEINASPGINMHQNPTIGKKINVSSDILDIIFPETRYDK